MEWRITGEEWSEELQTYSYAVKERKGSGKSGKKIITCGIKLLVQDNRKSCFYLSVLIKV